MSKFLLKPVKPFYINQGFGENKACIHKITGEVITPTGSCPSGYRSLYGPGGHNGLDLQAISGQDIYASHDGIVCEVVSEKERGLGIGIVTQQLHFCHETGEDEFFKTRYWHNKMNLVTLGQVVKKGDVIAKADSTGYSSGNHLHLELKPVRIVSSNKEIPVVENILQDNGFYGAVNPLTYLEDAPFRFDRDLEYDGGKVYSEDVKRLQEVLIESGYMTEIPKDQYGFYGKRTKEAVAAFQLKNVSLTWYERSFLLGKHVGLKTRKELNKLI